MRLSEFDYELPPERIAQEPLAERDASRLLWLHRGSGAYEDRWFRELPELLEPGDLLVANHSRVFPARLLGRRQCSGEGEVEVEVLLLERVEPDVWNALARPGRKLRLGERVAFAPGLEAEVIGRGERGQRRLRFHGAGNIEALIERHGHTPLPPYIRRPDRIQDRERYQTIFAQLPPQPPGSAAAPTAGLHFTPDILARLAARGVEWTTVSLHVGLGTFQAVECETIESHPMHREHYEIGADAARAINRARGERRRIIAVGTTSARVLETVAAVAATVAAPSRTEPIFEPVQGETQLFLYPGRPFHAVDGLLTNFHAPRTTLLMMIAAFAGTDAVRRAYQHALEREYRFLSYGDCMLIH